MSKVYRGPLFRVKRLEHDFQNHEGTLHTTDFPDLPSGVALFEKFDPEVRVIHTVVDGKTGMVFKKCAPEGNRAHGDGWQAYRPPCYATKTST